MSDPIQLTNTTNTGFSIAALDVFYLRLNCSNDPLTDTLEILKVGTQLKLSGGAADYATLAVAADGQLVVTTVDADAALADICLMPDGNVGINILAPLAKLHIDQDVDDAAIPVLTLDQADISDGFINFIGATAASAAGPISSWTVADLEGYVRCEINGVQKWVAYYADPTA